MSKASEAKRVERPDRVKMTAGGKLNCPVAKEEGFEYRWFEGNDKGRIEQALSAWWEPVKDATGAAIIRPSGMYNMHLMRIDSETYAKDKVESQGKVVQFLADAAKLGKDEYVPEGKTQAIEKDGFFDPLA